MISSYALDPSTGFYRATMFTSTFDPNVYSVDYDINGGKLAQDAQLPSSTYATFNNDDKTAKADCCSKKGYKFLCWNTTPDGTGVAIRDDEALSSAKLRAMMHESALEDKTGASTKLFAQWEPIAQASSSSNTDPLPIAPSEPDTPSAGEFKYPGQNVVVYPAGTVLPPKQDTIIPSPITGVKDSSSVSMRFVPSSSFEAISAGLTDPVEGFIDSVATPLSELPEAIPATPLEVWPVAAEALNTLSAEAIAGISLSGELTPTDATRAVGTVAAVVAVVTTVACVAGASGASAVSRHARRRRHTITFTGN